MPKKTTKKPAKTHEDLEGFEIRINAFGEIETNLDVDRINTFLNDHVEDKKLKDRSDSEKPLEPTEEE